MFLVKPDAAHLCCEMDDDLRLRVLVHPLNVSEINKIIFREICYGNFLIAVILEFSKKMFPQEPLAARDCNALVFHFLDESFFNCGSENLRTCTYLMLSARL